LYLNGISVYTVLEEVEFQAAAYRGI